MRRAHSVPRHGDQEHSVPCHIGQADPVPARPGIPGDYAVIAVPGGPDALGDHAVTTVPGVVDLTTTREVLLQYTLLKQILPQLVEGNNTDIEICLVDFVINITSGVDYSNKDFSTENHSTEVYSIEDYSTEDYSIEDYSTEDYSTEDYSTEDYSIEDYSTEDYSAMKNGKHALALCGHLRQLSGPRHYEELCHDVQQVDMCRCRQVSDSSHSGVVTVPRFPAHSGTTAHWARNSPPASTPSSLSWTSSTGSKFSCCFPDYCSLQSWLTMTVMSLTLFTITEKDEEIAQRSGDEVVTIAFSITVTSPRCAESRDHWAGKVIH